MILDSKYPRESFKNVDRDFSVLYVGYALNREFDKAFNFQGERHNFTEIVYVETGSVEVIAILLLMRRRISAISAVR